MLARFSNIRSPYLMQRHFNIEKFRSIQPIKTPQILRCSSHSPLGLQFKPGQRKKVTLNTLRNLYVKGEPIVAITAHDYCSGSVADAAGIEIVLVGDSLAMVGLGMEDTTEIRLEDMILFSRAVSRATRTAFTVADLPMGSYEVSAEQAVKSSIRIVKEGRAQGVKLEGGAQMAKTIKKITDTGIPVMGHVGLTPQRQNSLSGFHVQGRTSDNALQILDDALAVQAAGCFAVVLEAVPREIAAMITQKLKIPTIGIGAGNSCSGQILVQIDMLGSSPPGHHLPKFVKKYSDIWGRRV
ncbi:hypothetical protein BGHDH14_bgh06076 [Blumeria hordei DH14]|uniref:3-methyl-2-oxobutanoate hydroxymethyltransferase n=1 Tax=Blumeria graminis f. sp. hordei (strain DH14) TaxID=546991 RepID=N1JAA4_BLUG1|nr:hypothetical protein BGHDH14_bgh06076 [Blumeria hordei DH14]